MNRPGFALFKRRQMRVRREIDAEPTIANKLQTLSDDIPPSSTSPSGTDEVQIPNSMDLKNNLPEEMQSLPFLTFPGEIRNNIYRWTWLMSRERSEIYEIPDFQVHGDENGGRRGGIRWMNVPSFPLLLVNKQIHDEALPVVSAESWFEIKTYVDKSSNCNDPACNRHHINSDSSQGRAINCFKMIVQYWPLLEGARKVTMDFTPDKYGEWMTGLRPILGKISQLKKLRELTAKALINDSDPKRFLGLAYLFAPLKNNPKLTLCFELSEEVGYWNRFENNKRHKVFEKVIAQGARKYGGEKASVWVEWISIPDEDEDMGYY